MAVSANQPEVRAYRRESEIVYSVNDEKISNWDNNFGKPGHKCGDGPESDSCKDNKDCGILGQLERPPFTMFIIGFLLLTLTYVGYAIYISPSVVNFLSFLLNPFGVVEGRLFWFDYARSQGLAIVLWTGILMFISGMYQMLPERFADSLTGLVITLLLLFIPLILVWFEWPLTLLEKMSWTVLCLVEIWMFFVFPQL